MRIVLDTASFVAAVRSRSGAAHEVVRLILRRQIIPLMDLKLGLEYRDVTLRPHHLEASRLSRAEMLDLIDAIEEVAEPVQVVRKIRPMSSDPSDDMIFDIAINGDAEAIVTTNTKHFASAGDQYGVPVLSPAELLSKRRRDNIDAS